MSEVLAAVDIGATKITASLCSREGILIRLYQGTRLSGDIGTIPRQVTQMVDECFKRSGIRRELLKAVGISTAGPFEKDHGKLNLVSPNICGGLDPERGILPNDWTSIPLQEELEKHFPSLVIENDAVSGAIAERTFGTGVGCDNILYVTWSTGIGTGAFVDGRLIRGKNGNAPHGGHIFLVEQGPPCGCGNTGHLESLSSGTAIANEYGSGTSTSRVFMLYRDGNERAKEVVERAAKHFARGLASINAVLDTELMIIGGSVFLNNPDILLPIVKGEFHRSFPALSKGVRIVPSELKEYLGDIAAASLVIPSEWVEEWGAAKPWENAPETIFLE